MSLQSVNSICRCTNVTPISE